jgi:hypothetical protein
MPTATTTPSCTRPTATTQPHQPSRSLQASSPASPPVLRRRCRADPPDQPRLPPRGQQPRPAGTAGRLRHQQEHRRRVLRPRRRHRGHDRVSITPTS